MPLTTGQVIHERYRIAKLIGQGGYGAVYRAWDTSLNQPCALKENLDTSPEAQHQFQREAVFLAGLRHPNLPRVIDHFLIPGQGQYLVMDYIDGENLADKLQKQEGFISEHQALAWIGQVCDALEYLHSQNPPIIHRDIKPQNIIITPRGQAMLVDFGIAKAFDPNMSTATGARGITSGFSPPEQYGKGGTSALSDQYSLAATLYYLFTGQSPPDAIDRLVYHHSLLPPRQFNPQINPVIEKAILKGMELESSNRFPSISSFYKALKGEAQTAPQAQVTPATPPSQAVKAAPAPATPVKPATRPKGFPWLAIACLVTGVLTFPLGLAGIVGSFFLFKGSKWGKRLAMLHLIVLILILIYITIRGLTQTT